MNKEQMIGMLECCILSFEGISLAELINEHNFNPTIAKAGFSLYLFLKPKNFEGEVLFRLCLNSH